MFVSLAYLRDRLSGPRVRSDEVYEVRRRLVALSRSAAASQVELELAVKLRRLRVELSMSIGRVAACADCVRPRIAHWPGGHCCSGRTRELFTDDELAALGLAGTIHGDLKPPRAAHAGCAFRGPSGCSLGAAHRPSLCVGYLCRELERELELRGDAPAITSLQRELRATFEAFVECRKARTQQSEFESLVNGLRGFAAGPSRPR